MALGLAWAGGALTGWAEEANAPVMYTAERPLVVGIVIFEGFEQLDVFGPVEMLSMLRDRSKVVLLAERAGPVKGSKGVVVMADRSIDDPGPLDVVLVPGGMGTRREVNNEAMLVRLRELDQTTPYVGSVCTGSAVLAKAGILDGIRATTNKRAYAWATSQGPKVVWVPRARWVEDGKYITSSGVSAGMDMTLGLIAKRFDVATARECAQGAEYVWAEDATIDPFAAVNGL